MTTNVVSINLLLQQERILAVYVRDTGLAFHGFGKTLPSLSVMPGLDVLEGYLGSEVFAVPSLRDPSVQLVDLFKTGSFGLADEEVHECNADETERSPNEEDLALEIGVVLVDHIGCRVGNREIEQPFDLVSKCYSESNK